MKTRGRSQMPEITQTARMVHEDCIRPSCKTRAPMYVPSPRLLSYSQALNFVPDPTLTPQLPDPERAFSPEDHNDKVWYLP